MKLLFTILFLFMVAKAQIIVVGTIDEMRQIGADYVGCDSGHVDTIRARFDMKVPLKLWDYYHAGGLLLWGGKKYLDSSLIPEGGYVRQRMKDRNGIDGYVVLKVIDSKCHTALWTWMDNNYKPIPGIVKYWEIK